MNIIEHYDKLIHENNDPIYDPEPLKEYMNKWDGQVFVDVMKLDKHKTILEIGIGTGRLALKTAPLCKNFFGIDNLNTKDVPSNFVLAYLKGGILYVDDVAKRKATVVMELLNLAKKNTLTIGKTKYEKHKDFSFFKAPFLSLVIK